MNKLSLEEIEQQLEHNLMYANQYTQNGDKVNAKIYKDRYIDVLEHKKEHYGLERSEKVTLKTLQILRKIEGSNRLSKIMKRKIENYK